MHGNTKLKFLSLVCTSCCLVPEFWQVTKKPTERCKCPVTGPPHGADPTPRPLVAIQSLYDLKEVTEISLKGRLRQKLGKLKKSANAAWKEMFSPLLTNLWRCQLFSITVSTDFDTDATVRIIKYTKDTSSLKFG